MIQTTGHIKKSVQVGSVTGARFRSVEEVDSEASIVVGLPDGTRLVFSSEDYVQQATDLRDVLTLLIDEPCALPKELVDIKSTPSSSTSYFKGLTDSDDDAPF